MKLSRKNNHSNDDEEKRTTMTHDQCLELARFYHATRSKHSYAFVQRFIEDKCRSRKINERIPSNAFFRATMSDVIGDTLLHLAYTQRDIDAYRLLLSRRADFTLKNCRGSTVVHRIVEDYNNDEVEEDTMPRGRFKEPFLAATLFAHYEYGVRENPTSDRHGITHLHAACMANNAATVLQLLQNDDSMMVNQSVFEVSSCFPGYTPLHFAVSFSELCTLETIRILMKHGADVNIEDKYGVTALDILIERRAKILEMTNDDCHGRDLLKALLASEKILRYFVDECGIGISKLND